jgi:hypothetical protein
LDIMELIAKQTVHALLAQATPTAEPSMVVKPQTNLYALHLPEFVGLAPAISTVLELAVTTVKQTVLAKLAWLTLTAELSMEVQPRANLSVMWPLVSALLHSCARTMPAA